jgi:competence protein ComEA
MKKIFALLIGLAMFAMNAIAAVNVNTATQAQLETLNGIGAVKAKAIIDYRTKNGPFKTVDELDKVPGIGQGILGKIKADVAVSGETTVKANDKKAEAAKPAATAKAEEKKADDKTCEAKAAEKKLAGAAKTTFMKKCEADAKPAAKEEPKKTDKK